VFVIIPALLSCAINFRLKRSPLLTLTFDARSLCIFLNRPSLSAPPHTRDIFDVRDEKLFSAMCNWSNHCLHHLLPSERDTGHDLRRRGHSYQLVCYNFSSTIGVASLIVCCMIHCKHLRLSDANKLSYLLTYVSSVPMYSSHQQIIATSETESRQ